MPIAEEFDKYAPQEGFTPVFVCIPRLTEENKRVKVDVITRSGSYIPDLDLDTLVDCYQEVAHWRFTKNR